MINTLDEWNAALAACGCCQMPVCPTPILEIETKSTGFNTCGFNVNEAYGDAHSVAPPSLSGVPCDGACKKFTNYDLAYVFSGTESGTTTGGTYTGTLSYIASASNSRAWTGAAGSRSCTTGTRTREWSWNDSRTYSYPVEAPGQITSITDVGSGSGAGPGVGVRTTNIRGGTPTTVPTSRPWGTSFAGTISYGWDGSTWTADSTTATATYHMEINMSGPVDISAMEAEATLRLSVLSLTAGSEPIASKHFIFSFCSGSEVSDCPSSISVKVGRYRWRIPSTHTGTTFFLEWDEVLFPEGWDSPGYTGDPPTVTPKTYTWAGPGDPDDPNDPSWFSPWSDEVSVEDGLEADIELKNLRFTCYGETPYGGPLPQYAGDTYIPEE